ARKLNIDPMDIRIQNMSHPFDIDAATGVSLGSCKAIECINIGAEKFGWKERFKQNGSGGRFRKGTGLACSAHNNGMYSTSDLSTMTIRMNEDGSVQMETSLHEVGCGTLRSMQIIAAEVLQIEPDKIYVTEGDTKYSPYDLGSYGSRVTYVSGRCAYDAAVALKELIVDAAASFISVEKAKICLSEGTAYNIDNKDQYMSYADIALKLLMEEKIELIKTVSFNSISNPASYSANFTEVEVDTMTGLVSVKEFLSVNDIGQALNRGMVYRQVQGAVQMALGYGLREEIEYDSKGYPVTTSLKKYHPFNCADMPRVETILIEDHFGDGPFGAKGVGESATIAGAAAVVNAVNNALGTAMTELPLTPEKILKAIADL
ncbi:MAG: molybdopterin cofactor-binding domain-containing protein, partial [Synergistaceae bacterium]